jgi:hypothetical protein
MKNSEGTSGSHLRKELVDAGVVMEGIVNGFA